MHRVCSRFNNWGVEWMNVQLIEHTPNPLRVIYLAGRRCYSEYPMSVLQRITEDTKSEQEVLEFIQKRIAEGHLSILEHVNFTFSIDGISRACSHQLVRHRLASYSQQSQRYCEFNNDDDFVIPRSIKNNHDAHMITQEAFNMLSKTYQELLKLGINKEDARCLLPNATPTSLVVTMNLRSIFNFLQLRLCKHAQEEIRELAQLLYLEVNAKIPNVLPKNFCELCGVKGCVKE